MITYKQIIKASKSFSDAHHILKNFGNGELWQLSDHDQSDNFEYPLMYMVDSPSSPGSKSWVYAFRVYFVSRVQAPKDRDGNPIYFEYTSEKSAMIACAQDFLSYWVQDNNYKMTIDQTLGVTTFIDVQEDNVTGCYVDLRFVVPFTYDSCIIPMDGVPDPDSLNVEIYVNDTLYYTLTPGSSLMLNVIDTDGNPVDATVSGNNVIVPTAPECDPVTSTFNAAPLVSTPAGGNKDVTVENTLGVAKGTLITNTATELAVEIANVDWTDSDGTPQSTPYGNAIVCTPAVVNGEPIGDIYNIDTSTLADLSQFTTVTTGTTAFTLDGGYIKVTGTPAALLPVVNLIYQSVYGMTGLENWTFSFDFIIKSLTTADHGVGIGLENDSSAVGLRKELFYYYRRSGNASNGRTFRQIDSSMSPTAFTTALSPVIDRSYRMSLIKTCNSISVKVEDITTPDSEVCVQSQVLFDFSNTTGVQLFTKSSRPFICHVGGEHWISNIRLQSQDVKNGDVLICGDSIPDGYCGSNRWASFFHTLTEDNPTLSFTRSSGQGDYVSSLVNKAAEIQLINAGKIILFIGTNQVITSGAASAQASYTTLYNNLLSYGYAPTDIWHCEALPRGGSAAINTFNTYLNTTYGAQVIALNAYFNNGSNAMKTNLSNPDLIHPNDMGHAYIASQIQLIL